MIKFIMLLAVALLMNVTELSASMVGHRNHDTSSHYKYNKYMTPPGHVNDHNSANAMYIKYASVNW